MHRLIPAGQRPPGVHRLKLSHSRIAILPRMIGVGVLRSVEALHLVVESAGVLEGHHSLAYCQVSSCSDGESLSFIIQ